MPQQSAMMTLAYGGEVCSVGGLPLSCDAKLSALRMLDHRFCCFSRPFLERFRPRTTINLLMTKPRRTRICQRLETFDNLLPDLRLNDNGAEGYTARVPLELGQPFHHPIPQSRDFVPLATTLIPVVQTVQAANSQLP